MINNSMNVNSASNTVKAFSFQLSSSFEAYLAKTVNERTNDVILESKMPISLHMEVMFRASSLSVLSNLSVYLIK